MARYPESEMQEFLKRIRVANPDYGRLLKSSLSPLVKILESPVGTADQVKTALAALPEETRAKYRDAIRYLKWSYPGSDCYLGPEADALRTLLASANPLPTAIQKSLNQIPVSVAVKYQSALKKLMQKRSDVYYIGVETFTTAMKGTVASYVDQAQDRVYYGTPHFHATATTYSIVPASLRFDVGFVQVCSAKTQKQVYSDHGLETRWEVSSGFPISDSNNDGNVPFYYVGKGAFCNNQTAVRNYQMKERETFELDDSFELDSNYVGRSLYYTKNGRSQKSLLQTIIRKQSFIAWLVVKPHGADTFRLLKRVEYGFDFSVKVRYWGSQCIASIDDSPVDITESTPAADDTLPASAQSGPTLNAAEKLNVFVNGLYRCSIDHRIVLA